MEVQAGGQNVLIKRYDGAKDQAAKVGIFISGCIIASK